MTRNPSTHDPTDHEELASALDNIDFTEDNPFYPEQAFNRWQKHGHDRLYVRNGTGYIDLTTLDTHNLELHDPDMNFGDSNGNILVRNSDENVVEVRYNDNVNGDTWFTIPLDEIASN
jgi:hypothetical protein